VYSGWKKERSDREEREKGISLDTRVQAAEGATEPPASFIEAD